MCQQQNGADGVAGRASSCGGGEDQPPPIGVAAGPDGAPLPLSPSLLGGSHASDVTGRYDVIHDAVLGRGAFATTRLCVERATGRRLAVKSVHKRRLEGLARDWADVRREAQVMFHLAGHPNIVRLVATYEDAHYAHLVMELCEGGGLLERVMAKGRLSEAEAAGVMRALLGAVAYAHDMGCAHRDIKLDNLLLADDSGAPSSVRLADFGFSAFLPAPGGKLRGLCGTTYYIAPEVLSSRGGGGYDERADVWSCGVVLYVLLCGRPPFCAAGGRVEAVFRQIVDDGVPEMCQAPWSSVSDGAKDAVRRLMTWFPGRRPSAREMLAHPWVATCGLEAPAAGLPATPFGKPAPAAAAAAAAAAAPEVLRRMRSFASLSKLRRHAARVIAGRLPLDQIRGLRELFRAMAAPSTAATAAAAAAGPQPVVTRDCLARALERRGSRLAAGEIDDLIAAADADGDGALGPDEFLAATLPEGALEDEGNVLAVFKQLDRDGDGRISHSDLRAALAATGGGSGGHGYGDCCGGSVDVTGGVGGDDAAAAALDAARDLSGELLCSGAAAGGCDGGDAGCEGGGIDYCGFLALLSAAPPAAANAAAARRGAGAGAASSSDSDGGEGARRAGGGHGHESRASIADSAASSGMHLAFAASPQPSAHGPCAACASAGAAACGACGAGAGAKAVALGAGAGGGGAGGGCEPTYMEVDLPRIRAAGPPPARPHQC